MAYCRAGDVYCYCTGECFMIHINHNIDKPKAGETYKIKGRKATLEKLQQLDCEDYKGVDCAIERLQREINEK